jgi:two-component system nitrogen regulation response regulator NtrX
MRPKQLAPEAVEVLQAYRWPGNVRELKNLIERLLILTKGEEIRADDLPIGDADSDHLPANAPLKDAREDFERRYILAALKRHRGNVTRAAEALQVERSNLHRKLKSYGIEVERE